MPSGRSRTKVEAHIAVAAPINLKFAMSVIPPKADIGTQPLDVRFVPIPEVTRRGKQVQRSCYELWVRFLLIDPLLRSLG
jgi:hypothetical protein